jgi:hypothetical protein
MKTEGALGRRFSRHNEIYQSDVVIPSCKPGVGAASRWSAPWPSYRTRREVHALPIVLMSFDRLFLDRVARQQSPSPLHRQPQLKLSPCWTGTSFHRTATTPLTSCLSPGVHFRTGGEPEFPLPRVPPTAKRASTCLKRPASFTYGAFQSRAKISSVPASTAVTNELPGAAANQLQPAARSFERFATRSTLRSRSRTLQTQPSESCLE